MINCKKFFIFFMFLVFFAKINTAFAKSPVNFSFDLCFGDECREKRIRFSKCGENSEDLDGLCVCKTGFIGDGLTCKEQKCSAGYYGIWNPLTQEEDCLKCPAGYFCPNGREKNICPPNTFSSLNETECTPCVNGMYSSEGAHICCPIGSELNPKTKICEKCTKEKGCGCPVDTPFVNQNGECVACISDHQCPSGFCSKGICCPTHSSKYPYKRQELLMEGCYCLKPYQVSSDHMACVSTSCSSVENSSPDGSGDQTSEPGCYCNDKYPHWENGRCMHAKNCTVLMEQYGFKKDQDFTNLYRKEDQEFFNTIYIKKSFKTSTNMNLTGCNLVIDGDFINDYKIIVDSLVLNFSDFTYNSTQVVQNNGFIFTKGLHVSNLINSGEIFAPDATVSFGYLKNTGKIIVDSIYEIIDSKSELENLGTLTVKGDFLFGSMSDQGCVKNSGDLMVGNAFELRELFNWGTITLHKKHNLNDHKIYNEGVITQSHEN